MQKLLVALGCIGVLSLAHQAAAHASDERVQIAQLGNEQGGTTVTPGTGTGGGGPIGGGGGGTVSSPNPSPTPSTSAKRTRKHRKRNHAQTSPGAEASPSDSQ
jgi:hypothetical protein